MGLAALVGLGFTARPAAARVTTEQSASILVFPKVIADGTRDTIIQITNTSNNMRHAHCFYVNGALTNTAAPPGLLNPPLCTEIDFDIWLTKQQPTHWVVSTGRLDNPLDKPCRVNGRLQNCAPSTTGGDAADCCDAGYDPGHVPPVVPDFQGELKCIEVDASGFPVPGNALKGEATLENLADGDVSKYNAIGLKGFDTNNMDGTLCLGGGVVDNSQCTGRLAPFSCCTGVGTGNCNCPSGAEYEACPAAWILDHPSIGAADPVVTEQSFCTDSSGATINGCISSVSTNLTVVPCTENFETQSPQPITLQFVITNEFEQQLSASTTFQCWASLDLEDVSSAFTVGFVGGNILQTRMRSATGTPFGVMAVLEETHTDSFTISSTTTSFAARSAQNAHTTFQDQVGPDIITIPADQIQGQ
jgi:hypothetical protein